MGRQSAGVRNRGVATLRARGCELLGSPRACCLHCASVEFTASYLASPALYCPRLLGREPLIPRSEGREAGPASMPGAGRQAQGLPGAGGASSGGPQGTGLMPTCQPHSGDTSI